jgi:FkbM family methyltransferase
VKEDVKKVVRIFHKGVPLIFSAPNALSKWRYETFSSKEPETLEWIDAMSHGSVLWDVGANIRQYSIYAAKKLNCKVWAFEPSVFNLELLARNIYLSDLDNICIVPVALNDKIGESQMKMSSTEWGGALSTFGEAYGWYGKEFQPVFEFKTIGLTMENTVTSLSIPQPDYIKLDVDGIEHLIFKWWSRGIKKC